MALPESATPRIRPVPTPGLAHINLGSDYTNDEREFLVAVERYKREKRRPHPTWREVLQILLSLGYRKA